MATIPEALSDTIIRLDKLTAAVNLLAVEWIRCGNSARMFTPAEVAALFSYKESQVYALMDKGVIPWIRLEPTSTKRIPLIGLQALIAQHLKTAVGVPLELFVKLLQDAGGETT
jgi:hypothetical protein